LVVDVSAYGIGAVISHMYNDGSEKPNAYPSQTLSNTEKNYDKEMLALVFGI